MNKSIFSFFILLVFNICIAQNASKPVVASEIKWKAYKTLKTDAFSHFGTVGLKAGNLAVNSSNDIIGGNFIIDMNTILADDMKGKGKQKEMLERHLKSDDFFDVAKYPTAFFKLISVKKGQGREFNNVISGNLTLKGITKRLSFPANVVNKGNTISITSKMFTINRHDFNLTYNVFEDMIISDEVEMEIRVSAK